MKKLTITALLVAALSIPAAASAAGVEFAVGGWYVDPSGTISQEPFGLSDRVSLSSTAGFDEEWELMVRAKIQPPLLFGIYLQATPLSFSTTNNSAFEFSFGDAVFFADDTIDSDFFLNSYDAALYIPIPIVKSATFNTVSAEIGAGVRYITLRAELENRLTEDDLDEFIDTSALDDSERANAVYPEGYVAVQIRPVEKVALEGELWGYSWNGDKFWSVIGRLKVNPVGPLFVSGGYREDFYNFAQDDLRIRNAHFKGPFAEVGFSF